MTLLLLLTGYDQPRTTVTQQKRWVETSEDELLMWWINMLEEEIC